MKMFPRPIRLSVICHLAEEEDLQDEKMVEMLMEVGIFKPNQRGSV